MTWDNFQGRVPELDQLCCRWCLRALTIEGLSVGQERALTKHLHERGITLPRRNTRGLDAIHENIALAGGALLIIARRMYCEADVERMLKEGQDRVIAFLACAGLEGRA